MREEKVSLVACDSYGREPVGEAVAEALDLLGGVESITGPGQSVFIKPNAVFAAAPDSGIVTNPEVVRAVIAEFQKVTDDVTLGDSPGGPFNQTMLKRVYEKTGLADVARDSGAKLCFDTRALDISFPQGKVIKRLTLCRSMVEADCLVSVAKFKSHRFMNVTGPIKNLYGAIPGTTKLAYHSRFDGELGFADLVVDVHLAAAADFHVLDAIDVIDGDGSRKGTLRKMGVLAAGENAFALESLILGVAGLEPSDSKPLHAAMRRGVCPTGSDWYEVLGDGVESPCDGDFELPSENLFSERALALLSGRLTRLIAATPHPLPGVCTRCGKCAEVCPRGAISMGRRAAEVDLRKCIRCFCCDELCEFKAIGIRRPLLGRLLGRGVRS
ncbi:MAG: DUF362 domain-containing protein [Actinobacteria bacterium]|nr:DUF362 domain-containing protein [Actinomycetota bacterium]